ncbi:MAG: glycine cleavage system protein GcvH [Planctomycetota bacterium]
MTPADLKYLKSHEWVGTHEGKTRIGITDFAVDQLGDLVFVDLPAPGTKVTAGETFGEVESVKAVSDLYSPVSGTVVASNSGLADDTSPLADDPFGTGWMLEIEPSDPAEADALLDRSAYEAHCRSEG